MRVRLSDEEGTPSLAKTLRLDNELVLAVRYVNECIQASPSQLSAAKMPQFELGSLKPMSMPVFDNDLD